MQEKVLEMQLKEIQLIKNINFLKMKLRKLSETHYIITSDDSILEGDWYITYLNNIYCETPRMFEEDEGTPRFTSSQYKKITHSTQPIENISSFKDFEFDKIKSLSLSKVEEAIYGYSVEKMAEDYTEKWCGKRKVDVYIYDAFKAGFTAHKELVKDKEFTVEDMEEAIEMAQKESWDEGGYLGLEHKPKEIIQSLLPSTEWEIKEITPDGKIVLI